MYHLFTEGSDIDSQNQISSFKQQLSIISQIRTWYFTFTSEPMK